MTAGLASAWLLGPLPNRIRNTVCLGIGYELDNVRFAYEELTVSTGPKVAAFLGICLIVTEFWFYAAIFKHLHSHNQTMSLLLPEDRLKRRMRNNVVTLTGNLLKFVLKLVWITLVVIASTTYGSNVPAFQLVLWMANYGVIGILQVLISPKISTKFSSMMVWFQNENQVDKAEVAENSKAEFKSNPAIVTPKNKSHSP